MAKSVSTASDCVAVSENDTRQWFADIMACRTADELERVMERGRVRNVAVPATTLPQRQREGATWLDRFMPDVMACRSATELEHLLARA